MSARLDPTLTHVGPMLLLSILLGCDAEPDTTPAPEAPATEKPGLTPEEAEAIKAKARTATAQRPRREPPSAQIPERAWSDALKPVTEHLIARESTSAREALEPILSANPANADAWYLHGESYMLELNWAEAGTSFEKAVAADPDFAEARKRQLGALIGHRDCEAAMPLIATYQELRPDDHEALVMRSFCKGAENDHAGALEDVKLACERGFEDACKVVPRLEGRLAWIEKKEAELAEQKAGAEGGEGGTPE